jgi:hypothetical protein
MKVSKSSLVLTAAFTGLVGGCGDYFHRRSGRGQPG